MVVSSLRKVEHINVESAEKIKALITNLIDMGMTQAILEEGKILSLCSQYEKLPANFIVLHTMRAKIRNVLAPAYRELHLTRQETLCKLEHIKDLIIQDALSVTTEKQGSLLQECFRELVERNLFGEALEFIRIQSELG
jgi:hypothetical protein